MYCRREVQEDGTAAVQAASSRRGCVPEGAVQVSEQRYDRCSQSPASDQCLPCKHMTDQIVTCNQMIM